MENLSHRASSSPKKGNGGEISTEICPACSGFFGRFLRFSRGESVNYLIFIVMRRDETENHGLRNENLCSGPRKFGYEAGAGRGLRPLFHAS